MHQRAPTILFATPVLQHPPTGGPTLRIENSIKALGQVADLHLYGRVSLEQVGGEAALAFLRRHCRSVQLEQPTPPSPRLGTWLRRGVNKATRATIGRNLLQPPAYQPMEDYANILRTARHVHADVIWLGFGNISYPLLKHIKDHSRYPVVVDTDSVWSRYLLRGLPYAKNDEERQQIQASGAAKEEEERWGTRLADVTTAVSEVDAGYYRGLAPDSQRIHLFSNVIDLDSYAAVPGPAPDSHHPCLYLAGTFWPGSPMEHAARWVINHVLPRVRHEMPVVHFFVVGKGSDQVLADVDDPSITVTGQLHSVLPYLCHADVALVPLWFESGTRFKILEAGACRIPVVSTTLGAEGITVTHGHDILIADTSEEFAACVLAVLKDRELAKRLGNNLNTLIAEKYSLPTLIAEGQAILDYLGRRSVSQ